MHYKSLRRLAASLMMCLVGVVTFAQNTISGTIKDDKGEPIYGAAVVIVGTTTGTISDFDGNFSLGGVPNGAKLQASFIGYETQTVDYTGQSTINFTLKDDSKELEEVVAVGYGSVKKKDLTGSVATVNSETLAAVPVASATEALTGKLPGVQITTTEGSPDAEMKIRVRGGGSITQDNTPLYIVDGFPVETISDIPASEIEDMTVLKDASSTAIYGSRGANGVILVTTKSGKEGKTQVSYNVYGGFKKIAETLDVLSVPDYVKWQYEVALLKDKMTNYEQFFGSFEDIDLYDNVEGNDWQDLTFGRTGTVFNHSVNVTGGQDKIKYAFSFAQMREKAIMEGSNFRRWNTSLKLQTKPWERTNLDFSVRFSQAKIFGGGANDTESSYDTDKRLKYSVIYTPIPLSNLSSDSGNDDDDLGNLYHPLTAISDNDRTKVRKTLNMGMAFQWEIFKNFKVKTEAGVDLYRLNDDRFFGTTTYYVKNVPSSDNQGKPAIRFTQKDRDRIRSTNTISYDFKSLLPDSHSLNALVGHEYVYTRSSEKTNEVHGLPETFDFELAQKLSTQGEAYEVENYINQDEKLLSFFVRANYDFLDKYLLTATFRADGSSKFGDGNRWGYFPSAAVAWRISAENFMANTQDWLSDLKLRVSFGTAGNNNIPSNQITQAYEVTTTSWINDYSSVWGPSISDKTQANPDLKWETTVTRNVGLDFTLWNGKLSGNVDAYLNTTEDLLIKFTTSGAGYDYQYRNMGETENKGIEVALNYNIIRKTNFDLSVNANISFNKNKIKSLGDMEDFYQSTGWASTEIQDDFVVAKGGRVGQIRGYRSAGRYEVDDFESVDAKGVWTLKEGIPDASGVTGNTLRPGNLKIKDVNGDGSISTDDMEVIGDTNPKHTGGFGITARVFWFDISANFNWSVGNDVYNANKIEFTQTGKYQYRNMIDIMADGKRWTNVDWTTGTLVNDMDQLRAMNQNTTMWSPNTGKMVLTDWAVEDGSFLRLNTLTLGYTIPKHITQKWYIQNARFYVTAYNVFCITDYSGYDPEVSTMRKTNLTPGVDYSAYPKSRQFVVGANINF